VGLMAQLKWYSACVASASEVMSSNSSTAKKCTGCTLIHLCHYIPCIYFIFLMEFCEIELIRTPEFVRPRHVTVLQTMVTSVFEAFPLSRKSFDQPC
jgi:hypothetical protein